MQAAALGRSSPLPPHGFSSPRNRSLPPAIEDTVTIEVGPKQSQRLGNPIRLDLRPEAKMVPCPPTEFHNVTYIAIYLCTFFDCMTPLEVVALAPW